MDEITPHGDASFDEADGERITVEPALAGLDGTDDGEHEPGDADDGQDEEADEDEDGEKSDGGVNGEGDVEVHHLLARGIQIRIAGALHQPQDQRADDVAAKGNDETGKA